MKGTKELWLSAVNVCREADLFEDEDFIGCLSDRIDCVRFKLGLFYFEVYCDKLTGEFGTLWRLDGGGFTVSDPVDALFYFCSVNDLPAIGEGGRDVLAELQQLLLLCSRNRWIFHSLDWIGDTGLRRAWEAANEWARQQNRPMRLWEFERRINAERQGVVESARPSEE